MNRRGEEEEDEAEQVNVILQMTYLWMVARHFQFKLLNVGNK